MTAFHIDYGYELLDRDENLIGPLVGVVHNSGRLTHSAGAQVHTGAQFMLRDTGQVEHWAQARVKITATVNDTSWPLGVFVPSVPEWEHTEYGRTATVTLADKTVLLQRDSFGLSATGVPAGANIVSAAQDIITSTGEGNVALTPDDAVLSASVEWEPDKNKLTCVNTLLDASNFFSLWCDGDGQFQVTPYQSPQSRGVTVTLVEGVDGIRLPAHGIHAPAFKATQDLDKVPNVYQAVSATEGDDPALFAEAVNDDPDDPLSTVNRGRVMPESGPEFDVPTSGQSALQAYANRKLIELSLPSLTLEVWTPPRQIKFNDVVRFVSDSHGIDGLFVVSNLDANLAADDTGIWKLTLRKVVEP